LEDGYGGERLRVAADLPQVSRRYEGPAAAILRLACREIDVCGLAVKADAQRDSRDMFDLCAGDEV
jgi:hypothetical protein